MAPLNTLDTRGSEASHRLERGWAALQAILPGLPSVVCVILPAGSRSGRLGQFAPVVGETSPHTKPMNWQSTLACFSVQRTYSESCSMKGPMRSCSNPQTEDWAAVAITTRRSSPRSATNWDWTVSSRTPAMDGATHSGHALPTFQAATPRS